MTNEVDKIPERYARRQGMGDLYNPLKLVNLCFQHERERALRGLLVDWLQARRLSEMAILEIGCGHGDNLLQLIRWGAAPSHIVANELLPNRLAIARTRLPADVTILPGDAAQLPLEPASLDIVVQSTVFSSILDRQAQEAIARKAWSLLRPGGLFLWYDFTYDNPRNPDVRGVSVKAMRSLFPHDAQYRMRRITLAPPIARKVVPLGRHIYAFLAGLKVLNTHLMVAITKPARAG